MELASHETISLAVGFSLVSQAFQNHTRDACITALKHLASDKMFCAFLGASTLGFLAMGASEYHSLSSGRTRRERKQVLKNIEVRKGKKPVRIEANAKFVKEFLALMRIAIPGPMSKGFRLMTVQFFLLVMRTLITVRTVKLNTHYLTMALSKGSWNLWMKWFTTFAGWMTMGVVTNSGLKYIETLMSTEFRKRLTAYAHKKYCQNNNFYRANVLGEGDLDHVDQRIVADIQAFSKEAAFLYGHSFKPVLEFFLGINEAAKELGIGRPIALFTSQVVITMALRKISPSLGKFVAREQALEGSFRHAHSRLCASAEEIAFLKGGEAERSILERNLQALLGIRRWHALALVRKSIADQIAKFQGLLIGGAIIHIPFLARKDISEAERISRFRVSEELMLKAGGAFTEVMLLQKELSQVAGYTHRISELFKGLKAGENYKPLVKVNREPLIVLDQVTVKVPSKNGTEERILVKDLDLEIVKGKHILITGPNGCGKTSLIRTLAGLWPQEAGNIQCSKKLMFLPQRPYLVVGNLRDQVTYPIQKENDKSRDEEALRCLRLAGLTRLAEAVDGLDQCPKEWNEILSGGERQRVGFARVFYHKPDFVVLDEATSAINPEQEIALYKACQESGVTMISIAHRMELRKFHKHELKIEGDGSGKWEVVDL